MHSIIVAVVSAVVGVAVGYAFRGREAAVLADIKAEQAKVDAAVKAKL
jgi:hypothetical protein